LDTRERLQELGIKPVGGQHFLDLDVGLERFLEELDTDGKNVLEMGAGTGNITERLEAEKIYAVEKDTVLAEGLEERDLDCEILNKDFLEMEIPEDVEYLVGNLPFEISSDILEKAGKAQLPSVFIVQEEFADKVVASPGDSEYNFFSFKANYYFVPVKAGIIAPGNYYPEPEVSTAVIKLFPNKERHGVEDDEALLDFAKALFTHKNKKLRNAFVDARHILEISKDEAKDLRDELPHSEKRVNKLEVFEMAEAMKRFQNEK
jgi:16S rRNA (adenine1518-N6/adenine1519-N6)-dimethyltransferase